MLWLSLYRILLQGNILSSDLVNYIMRENNIDTVMHYAAQSHVGTVVHSFVHCLLPSTAN